MTESTRLILQPGVFAYRASNLIAKEHSHNALQWVIPERDANLTVNEQNYASSIAISSGLVHKLTLSAGWIVLIEPSSVFGEVSRSFLAGQKVASVANAYAPEEICAPGTLFFDYFNLWLDEVFGGRELFCGNNSELDNRILQLLNELDVCFEARCLKPASWRAKQVAQKCYLSEGRFLHLFREQMGITWRAYLLWRRLLCAVKAMSMGNSATHAAHQAGFSDSAHLSRTFRRHFGLSIRELGANQS